MSGGHESWKCVHAKKGRAKINGCRGRIYVKKLAEKYYYMENSLTQHTTHFSEMQEIDVINVGITQNSAILMGECVQ